MKSTLKKFSALFLAAVMSLAVVVPPTSVMADELDDVLHYEGEQSEIVDNEGEGEYQGYAYEPQVFVDSYNFGSDFALGLEEGRGMSITDAISLGDNDINPLTELSRDGPQARTQNGMISTITGFLTFQGQSRLYGIIDLFPGEVLHVQADMPNSAAIDYDLMLIRTDWFGNLLEVVDASFYTTYINGANGTLSEAVGFRNTTNSVLFFAVAVESFRGSSATMPYTIHIGINNVNDSFEADENVRSFRIPAANLPASGNLVVSNRAIDTLADNDWLRLQVPASNSFDRVAISLDQTSVIAGYTVEVYTRLAGDAMRRINPVNGNEFVLPSGTVYVRVSSVGALFVTGVNYALSFEGIGQTQAPTPDNPWETRRGTISSAAFVYEFTLTIDYSENPNPAIALIRSSGRSNAIMTIVDDQTGATIANMGVGAQRPSGGSLTTSRHFRFTRPAGSNVVRTYTVRVAPGAGNFIDSTDFHLNIGRASDLDRMMTGPANATTIYYRHRSSAVNTAGNSGGLVFTSFTPSRSGRGEGSFYRFFYDPTTTITIANHTNNTLRFRIWHPNSVVDGEVVGNPIFDSNGNNNQGTSAQRTQHLRGWRAVEKGHIELLRSVPGLTTGFYYLEVYNLANTSGFITDGGRTMAFGDPIHFFDNSQSFTATTTTTGAANQWSADAIINVPVNSVPRTAMVTDITVGFSPSVTISQLTRVRARPNTNPAWRQSAMHNTIIRDWNPTMTNNAPLAGQWRVGFMTNGNRTLTVSMTARYVAELGD